MCTPLHLIPYHYIRLCLVDSVTLSLYDVFLREIFYLFLNYLTSCFRDVASFGIQPKDGKGMGLMIALDEACLMQCVLFWLVRLNLSEMKINLTCFPTNKCICTYVCTHIHTAIKVVHSKHRPSTLISVLHFSFSHFTFLFSYLRLTFLCRNKYPQMSYYPLSLFHHEIRYSYNQSTSKALVNVDIAIIFIFGLAIGFALTST
jgi:hypothetical protein